MAVPSFFITRAIREALVVCGMSRSEAQKASKVIGYGLTAATFGKAAAFAWVLDWAIDEGFWELADYLTDELIDIADGEILDLELEAAAKILARDGGALALLTAIERGKLYMICDKCQTKDLDAWHKWRVTDKGNLKCTGCGKKNKLYECERCEESVVFRKTKKGNFRCVGDDCDKKVYAPEA